MVPKRKHNPKRRIAGLKTASEIEALAKRVRYVGSGHHKRFASDFNLAPPLQPRRDAELCDLIEEFRKLKKQDAQALLESGVRLGMVSEQTRGHFPQNIWSVTTSGRPVEAELDNQELGTYHGYPMGENDPFAAAVLKCWNERN